jgi:hypothetical protein
MSRGRRPSKDPDILASAQALRRAARRALELGRSTGTPVYVMKRGKIVDIAGKLPAPARRKQNKDSRPL